MLPVVLALSGTLVIVAVVAAIVGLIAIAVYSIRTLRTDEGWEERPPKQDDIE
jgi:hypothetical protein